VLALAVLPSGSPAGAGQVILAVSGGALALVVLWQAHQAARPQAPVLERTA
jgi:alpha-1,6-mannosyltransferase